MNDSLYVAKKCDEIREICMEVITLFEEYYGEEIMEPMGAIHELSHMIQSVVMDKFLRGECDSNDRD